MGIAGTFVGTLGPTSLEFFKDLRRTNVIVNVSTAFDTVPDVTSDTKSSPTPGHAVWALKGAYDRCFARLGQAICREIQPAQELKTY
jgi:hypothetical protein